MPEKIKLQKFVDELPILKTLSPKMRSSNKSYYEVTMKDFSQKLHRDLEPTRYGVMMERFRVLHSK